MASKAKKSSGGTDNGDANRKRRLVRTLKAQPNNLQVVAALLLTITHRKTPKVPFWSQQRIATAKLFKAAQGKVNLDIFHKDPKVSGPAMMLAGPSFVKQPSLIGKSMYSLGLRANCATFDRAFTKSAV